MKRFLASLIFLFITLSCFSQKLDSYKYVIVPYEFEFLKRHDQYRVNTLVRHLFKKEGFEVLYDNEDFPDDLKLDRCLALFANVKSNSNIFTTKMTITLKDCSNKVVLESLQGRSKIKAYKESYNQSIKRAFATIEAANYSYKPAERKATAAVNKPKEVVKEVKPMVSETKETSLPTTTVKQNTQNKTATSNVLYAQPIKNGYQLVDSTPKVVMVLLKTGVPDVFIVKGEDATVYKKDGVWKYSVASKNGYDVLDMNIKF